MKNQSACPWTTAVAVLACFWVLAACGGQPAQESESETSLEGAEPLYQAQCALCHGVLGDGQGTLVLDRPARSFLKGAFSFGNTEEALFRTISNGIGGTPMPGFKSTLSEEQRRALAQYVIELGPEQVKVQPGQSEMHVTDKPLIVRGGLPPIADGLAPVTRGLLVGGMDGLTFEYNTKPLALLGVRQGGFVDRKDWAGRGGALLQPLGVVSHVVDGASSAYMWMETASDGSWTPLEARLMATEVTDVLARIEYEFPTHKSAGTVSSFWMFESGEAVSVAGWPGFRRTFTTNCKEGFAGLQLTHLGESKTVVIGEGPGGRLLRRKGETQSATLYFEHAGFQIGHNSTMWVDTLYGLEPTDENLKGLKELIQ